MSTDCINQNGCYLRKALIGVYGTDWFCDEFGLPNYSDTATCPELRKEAKGTNPDNLSDFMKRVYTGEIPINL